MSRTINISWNPIGTFYEPVAELLGGLENLLKELTASEGKELGEAQVLDMETHKYKGVATVTVYEADHAIVVLYDRSKSESTAIDLLFFPGNMYHEVRSYLEKLPGEICHKITGLHINCSH